MAEIQGRVVEKSERNWASRLLNTKSDKDAVAAWRQELVGVLHVFNVRSISSIWHSLTEGFQTEMGINTHVAVERVDRNVERVNQNVLAIQEGAHHQCHSVSATSPPLTKQR